MSSEPKTRLTAEFAAVHFGLPIYEDPRLDELQRGGWVEDYAARVASALATPHTAIGEWESAASALKRARESLQAWQANFYTDCATRDFCVVGHGISLSLVRAWILERTHVNLREWQALPFGAWATIDLENQKMVRDFEFGGNSR